MDELEYITVNALMMCDQGAAPDYFKPTYNTTVKIHGCLVATNKDAIPIGNIPSFKACKITKGPCVPATAPLTWQDTWQVKIKGINSLIGKSTCQCAIGGKIEFMTSGQVPLPQDAAEEVTEMQKQAQKELDDSGNGNSIGEAGFAEGLIPVWGSGRDLINDIQTGNAAGAVMNAGFLIWDVASVAAGVVSFGAATAAMQGAKTGLKATMKAGAKVIAESAMKNLGKAGFKKLSKQALKNSIDDVAKKLLKSCVFACFPAGTIVHTEHGIKNIEDIQIGDLVWAYDEDTDTLALQPVIDIMQNESDHTISLYTENEVIETTATHPFYTEEGWKDASELEEGDKILTKEQEKVEIKKAEYNYQPKKVFNFEVAHFHTYFVGQQKALVHNSGKCLSKFADDAIEGIAKTWDDLAKFKHCFAKGTLVKIENGYAPIETLQKGDLVACYNFENTEVIYSEVNEIYCNTGENIFKIYIDDDIIECTQNHQFWSVTHKDWVIARNLSEGDLLLSANGNSIRIKQIQFFEKQITTYNLEVEDYHNYFVSSLDILVHNGNPFPNSAFNDLTPKMTEIYGIWDKKSKQFVYVGKTIQEEGKRFGQHVIEKGLDPKRYVSKTIDSGMWNAFQTATREQYHIMQNGTKTLKSGASIKNKINAIGKKKFDYFSKLIKCP
ncbi:polymorphic toxin-type HINT domain-containing protein [Flavobacterium oreochromis]|uniref:Polymorphic toxin-type HINT domain-containing protein n=1 Tax=Flavobacterium oreochromis TaxID=2906078 RepID=A0ABW8P5B4_9FLAO|nr:polymorphic toxin-type HINT domain-containing protein [Flavobacterium oreochromis]OWP79037.1 hypothetical protein BWG23_00395 [Flavobacterium oreochromis]POR30813.1 hypothetical protein BWK58_00505 [Flavobacterium columnare]